MLHQNALNRNASLAGIAESPGHAAIGGVFEIGVAVHNDGGVAAQFEHDFLFSRARVLMSQPTGTLPVKADELDAVVGDQQAGIFIREREHVESAIGPTRLLHALGEKQRAERRLRRRLQHHGATGGNGRRNFVGDEIDGEIKWSDAGDWSERKAAHNAPAAGGKFLPVKGKKFAVDAGAFFGGHIEGEDGAVDFDACGFDGLSGFLREGAGKFFFALQHGGGNPAENALAFKGGQPARGAESLDGGGNGRLGVFTPALHDAGNQAAIVRGANFYDVAVFAPPAIHKKPCVATGAIVISAMIFPASAEPTGHDYRTFG